MTDKNVARRFIICFQGCDCTMQENEREQVYVCPSILVLILVGQLFCEGKDVVFPMLDLRPIVAICGWRERYRHQDGNGMAGRGCLVQALSTTTRVT